MPNRRSKKRLGTSSRPDEQPDLPTIYVDESLCQTILWRSLKDRGCDVIRRADRFAPGVSDPEWLEVAGREGWIVFTKDQAITRRPNEMAALVNAGVRAFVLTAGEMTGPDQATLFTGMLPKLRQLVKALRRGPFVVRVNRDRSTEVLHPKRRRPKGK